MEDEDRGTAPPRNGSATGTRPKAATSKPSTPVEDRTDRLERIVKSVVEYQRRQHDQAEAEFFRQDQRWKAMEHQFQQLQRMAREPATTQATGQSLAAARAPAQLPPFYSLGSTLQHALSGFTNSSPTSHGMRSSLNSTSLGLATSPNLHRGWRPPKMAPLEEHEDVEHYLTTFERLATACQWPLETWVLCPC